MDYAATTPVDPRVFEAMRPFFSEKFGNPSSIHSWGEQASEAIEQAREYVASVISASPDEIFFTSGGTESNNWAIKGVLNANKNKKHIIISKIEHPSVFGLARWLAKAGYKVDYIDVDKYGFVNLTQLEKAIRPETALVSIMAANNEIGTIEPIKEIGELCDDKGVIFHTDAVQAYGKIKINLKKLNIDLLSVSSHKIYGPKGVGALFIRDGVKIDPLLLGGGQEKGLRSGTENVPGIVVFGFAAKLIREMFEEEKAKLTQLRNELIKNILKIKGAHLNGHPTKRLPNNANFWFEGVEGESIVLMLDQEGIAASTGSACAAKKLQPSRILLALGLTPTQAHGSLRLTIGRFTTQKDIDYVCEKLPPIIEKLRKISPIK